MSTDMRGRSVIDVDGWLNYAAIRDYERAHADLDADAVAAALVEPMTKAQLVTWARRDVADLVETFRRDAARTIERQAERPAEKPAPPVVTPKQPYHELLQSGARSPVRYMNSKERKDHRKSLVRAGTFDEWYDKNWQRIYETGTQEDVERFEADWHPGGMHAYYDERRTAAIRAHISVVVAETAERVRLETTQELLSSVFALGDGERVTWGDANVKQHEQRIELLVGNAAGNVESAARHQAAIRMILDAGVNCLSELSTPS